ncbi:protein MIX23-like [Ornithodoros turicata]|uniref:protein MIX23-like n=1 Tax=Ornithodoros turicata TaxID=34597 RepID=UPI0031397697
MAAPIMTPATCEDFLAFQEILKKLRKVDDNIVYALNTTIPTESFAPNGPGMCRDLYEKLLASYSQREKAIKQCLQFSSDRVHNLKEERSKDPDNLDVLKRLRKEQTQLRLMQNELNVEEVVKDRSFKIFHERCRLFYNPPSA